MTTTPVNSIYLWSGPTVFNTIHLPSDGPFMAMSPVDRESYVELGDGWRPITARVWMTQSQFLSLPSSIRDGNTPVGIKMSGNSFTYPVPESPPAPPPVAVLQTMTFSKAFYIVHAAIVSGAVTESIYEVLLQSEAFVWDLRRMNWAWNILSADKLSYAAGATSASVGQTYQNVMNGVGASLGVSLGSLPFTPTAIPQELTAYGTPAVSILRRLLRVLGCQLAANPFTSSSAITYKIERLDYTNATGENTDLLAVSGIASYNYTSAQHDDYFPVNGVTPASIEMWFPKWPIVAPSGATAQEGRYTTSNTSRNPIGGGIAGTKDTIFIGDHFDCGLTSKRYTESLSAIATERASIYWKRALIPAKRYLFIGGYPFVIGPTIRRVRWSMEAGGWFTEVIQHGNIDTSREDRQGDMRLASPVFNEHETALAAANFPRDDGTIQLGTSTVVKSVFKITAHTQDGSFKRWTYTARNMKLLSPGGYENWSEVDDTDYSIKNIKENMNRSSGLYGNGVNSSNLWGTFNIQPIPTNDLVEAELKSVDGGSPGWWMDTPNGIDGACS